MNAIKNKRYVTRFFKNRLHAFYFFSQWLGIADLPFISFSFSASSQFSSYPKKLIKFYGELVYCACYQVIFDSKNSNCFYNHTIPLQYFLKLQTKHKTIFNQLIAPYFFSTSIFKEYKKRNTHWLLVEVNKLYKKH